MSENLKGKRLLILGGSYVDRKIIATAKNLGVITYITDSHPVDRSPAKIMADYAFTISADAVDEIVNLCRREKIDGVLSLFHDFSQIPYRIICERLNFPCFGNEEQFALLTNKLAFKKFCEDSGIGTINYCTSNNFGAAKISYPVIVKPFDGRGSKGQSICNSPEEVGAAVDFAKSVSKYDEVVIEEYLGNETDLELAYLVINGEPILQKVGDRYLGDAADGLDKLCIASLFPSRHFNFYRDNIDSKVVDAFRKLNFANAPIFVQGFLKDNFIKFYDPGLRLLGDDFDVGYKNITGIDVPEMFIRFALTGRVSNEFAENIKRVNHTLHDNFVGMILPCVRAGDEVGVFKDSRQRFGEFIIVGKNVSEIQAVIKWLFDNLRVLDADGADMLIAKFDPKLLDANR